MPCASASHVLESDNIVTQSSVDADDRYEAWRYEYTPTLKDLYLDVDVKYQVQKLMTCYFRSACDDDNRSDSDEEISKANHAGKAVIPPSKLWPTPTELGKLPVPPLAQPISPPRNNTDSTTKSQRAAPHSFGSTQFLPVAMSELPPPLKLTIKAIPPSAINFFPSLTSNPFCPNFSNSLNNSSTSSLPRLITHGVFSAQPISRGSYIASLKGSITSVKKYTQDVFSQYDTLGCNKPYVKFFKSTRLANRLLRGQELEQIEDGLVIDSRQYGNEMRFIRNGCHPNAFINIIMTPGLHNAEFPKSSDLSRHQSSTHRSQAAATEKTEGRNGIVNSKRDPWSVAGSTMDRDLHLPWEISFGVFAASDISRREEIILPWDWDDQHLVHLLPRLLSHSSTFEIQQQQRSPPLPPVRSQFLPWSNSDLKLLSRKLAAVTLTLFGLMFCGCERKKSCAINLMWKMGCLSAGEPMFPTNSQDNSSGNQPSSEILPISNLKERQEMNLPLTFEEKFRLVLYSFLEQPNHLTSKLGRNLSSNVTAPTTGRPRKHKIDLGPLLGLRRDWWNYSPGEQAHPQTSQAIKVMARKQKRPRSRSVLNRIPSINKIRRVSDIGELRRHGVSVPKDNNQQAKSSAVSADDPNTTESGVAHPCNEEKSDKDVELRSDFPNQSNGHLNPLSSTTSPRKSPEVDPRNESRAVQSIDVIPPYQIENRPVEPVVQLSDSNNACHNTHNADSKSGQDHESNEVSNHQPSLANEESASIPVSLPVSESVKVFTSETINIESVEPEQAEENMISDTATQKVSRQEELLETEAPPSVPHQSQLETMTDVQTSGATEVQFENLDHESSGVGQQERLVEDTRLTEEQTVASESVNETPIHTIRNEPSDRLEFGLADNTSGQRPSVSANVERLVKSPSPRQAKENSDPDQTVLAIFPPQNSQQDLSEVNVPPGSPTCQVIAEPMSVQQTDANAQDPTCHQEEMLPIPSTEPIDPSSQSVNTAPAAEASFSQSGLVGVDVHQEESTAEKDHVDVTDQSVLNSQEQNSIKLVPSSELKSETLVGPLENESPKQIQANSPSRMMLRSVSVSNESELEAQDESVLSHPSEESEESLLDSDASTTILDSSDEEMLSSHTPRYLNNRKRIRSKNIIKPLVRMGAVNKNHKLDRSAGLTSNGITRSFKSDGRPPDRLGTSSVAVHKRQCGSRNEASSMSSNLDSEEEPCANSSKTAPRESSSKMRMTIRSSSPTENDTTTTTRPQHRPRIASTPPSSSASDLAQNSPGNAEGLAVEELALPQLVPTSTNQLLPPADSYSQDANQQGTVTRSEEHQLINPKGTSDHEAHPPTSSKVNFEDHTAIDPQQQSANQSRSKTSPLTIGGDAMDLEVGLEGEQPTTCVSSSSVLESSAPKNPSHTPSDRSNAINNSSESCTHPPDNELKNNSLDLTSAAQSVKQPPKRISLKDYRSRKGGEPVNVTPVTNPLVQFATGRPPPTTISETSQKKQPPPPLIPALPPLLPPSQQSQPLLPLSPRKLELVASVLKKEDKDRALLRDEQSGSSPNIAQTELPPPALPPPLPRDSSTPLSAQVDHAKQDGVWCSADQSRRALGFPSRPKETDLADKSCDENGGNPSVSGLVSNADVDADQELLEDDIDGVAIESMTNPSEDGFDDEEGQRFDDEEGQHLDDEEGQYLDDEQRQRLDDEERQRFDDEERQPDERRNDDEERQHGLESSKTYLPSEEKDTHTTLMSLSPDDDGVQMAIPDPIVNPPDLEEQGEQMNVDKTSECFNTPTVEKEDQVPPPVTTHASCDDNDVSDCSPAPESRHREDSTALEKSVEPVQNRELDTDGSPDRTVQPRAPARPRLSLAAYRQRLAAARCSTSEEPHQSQSSSPFLPDLELLKVTPDPSTSRPPSHQALPISVKQEQPDTEASQSGTSLQLNISAQNQNPSAPPSIRSLDVELEPKLNITTSAENSEVASDLRTGDATMYFPPISPSILMAAEESPRSPELKFSPSPGPQSQEGRGSTHPQASLSPRSKSPERISLESTPVPSTNNNQADVKEGLLKQSAIPRVVTESPTKPSDHDPKSLAQISTSRAPVSSSRQSVSHQPSPSKPTSTTSLDHPKSSPSIHTSSLPTSMPPHPIVNQYRRLTPTSSGLPSSSHPTPIPPLALTPRINTSESSTHKPPMDQSLPPAPSPRLLMGSSTQRSPKISLSPQPYGSSISPSSPAPTGVSDPRSSPRGSSNFITGSSRGGHLRGSHRPPHHFNSSSAPPRASWPSESATTPNSNDTSKPLAEALPGSAVMSTTSVTSNNVPKNPADIPPPSSLPMIPNHAMGGIPRNNHPYHHLPPHRPSSFFTHLRNFPDHRTASMPLMETSGPGPPSSQFRPPPNSNGGVERVRYDGLHRNHMSTTRSPPPYLPPHRGRAKVRGTGQSYWPIDNSSSNAGGGSSNNNSSSSSNNNARNFGNGSRN